VTTDFLGVNFYVRVFCKEGTQNRLIRMDTVKNETARYTEMNWEVYPAGIREILLYIQSRYNPAKVYITESGAAFVDNLDDSSGRVHDTERVNYYRGYVAEALNSIGQGVPLKGYFAWSLLDNFEWAYGFSKRFGLIYTDYATQRRYIKDSGLWFAKAIAENGYQL
jgi:beta-glucosidase